jgi:hypothetical protein
VYIGFTIEKLIPLYIGIGQALSWTNAFLGSIGQALTRFEFERFCVIYRD